MRVAVFLLAVTVAAAAALPFSPYPLWATDLQVSLSEPVVVGEYVYVAPRSDERIRKAPFSIAALKRVSEESVFKNVSNRSVTHDTHGGSVGYAGPDGGPSPNVSGVVAVGFTGFSSIEAVDAVTGAFKWSYSFADNDKIDMVSGDAGRIFVTLRKSVQAFDQRGNHFWTHTLAYDDSDQNMRKVLVWQNRVGIYIEQGMVVGLDVNTGGALWSSRGDGNGWTINFYGQVALSADGAVTAQGLATNSQLTSNNGTLAAMNANNGQTLFQAIFPGDDVGKTPGGNSGVSVFAPWLDTKGQPPYSYLQCYNYNTGEKLWTGAYEWYTADIVVGDNVYVTAVPKVMEFSAKLFGFDKTTGATLWTVPSPFGHRPPIYVDGVLYGGGGEYSASHTSIAAIQVEPSSTVPARPQR